MASETAARDEVLRRIRTALGGSAAPEASIAAEWMTLPRAYIRTAALAHHEVLELLEDRLRDYDAHVVRVQPGGIGDAVASLLTGRGMRKLVIPIGLAETLAASGESLPISFDFEVDHALSIDQINLFEGVVTTSTVAIAQTGTIVLQNVLGQGRRAATLIPDYHLCLVRAADVVETVPEAMALLEATSTLATTFVSGPSATADIEMTRIKGVHGPRFLDVILVE